MYAISLFAVEIFAFNTLQNMDTAGIYVSVSNFSQPAPELGI